jgi:hypothetical protein
MLETVNYEHIKIITIPKDIAKNIGYVGSSGNS